MISDIRLTKMLRILLTLQPETYKDILLITKKKSKIYLISCWSLLIIFIITSNYKGYIVKYIVCGPILPYVQNVGKEGLGPISSLRINEYPRTSIRGMDKIAIRGEVEHVGEELGRVRGQRSPRDSCPRYLVNSLITQNNAWDKSYNRAKEKI